MRYSLARSLTRLRRNAPVARSLAHGVAKIDCPVVRLVYTIVGTGAMNWVTRLLAHLHLFATRTVIPIARLPKRKRRHMMMTRIDVMLFRQRVEGDHRSFGIGFAPMYLDIDRWKRGF